MWLKTCVIPNKDHIFLDPSLCFIIEVYLVSKNYKVFNLLDSKEWNYFLDEAFVKK